jgi:hypothetical protein
MPSLKEIKYYWGVLLEEMVERFGVPEDKKEEAKEELHKAFKDYVELDSITKLDTYDTERYLNMIRMLMIRERGIILREPHETEDIEQMSMRTFLKKKLYK